MNCATALLPAHRTHPKQKFWFSDSTAQVTVSKTWQDFFINNDPRGDCNAF